MFKKFKDKRAEKKVLQEKIANDEYLIKLNNSARGFCGTRYSGEGPFLSINEVKGLIWAELQRKSKEA